MPAKRDRWVVCADIALGPYSAKAATRKLDAIVATDCCSLDHEVVTSATKPEVTDSSWPEDEDEAALAGQ